MPDDGEKYPLTERLFMAYDRAFRAVARWATGGRSAADPDGAARRQGCANPFILVKAVIVLFVIVLMPLFMLPLVLVRLAQVGQTGFRGAAAINSARGDAARWGHGVLPPLPDPAAIRAGVATIAGHDPGFRAVALTEWAAAAVALIEASLVSGDASPARTFMSSGLYRAHQALLELRARAGVSCAGSWQAVQAFVVEASRSALEDQVRVRVICRGWCLERHEPTSITLRGGPDVATWSEDLTFARAATAVTPVAGGLPARRCPSCGAGLDLGPDGACRYCKGIVTAGRDDWVLVSWQREPW
jgi:hypothetical protein